LKVKRKKLATILCLCAAALICAPSTFFASADSASASSASIYLSEDNIIGSVVLSDNCPIEVEEANLTFNIPQLPGRSFLYDEQAYLNYNANVVAEYNLFNPTAQDETLWLAYPVDFNPSYCYKSFDETTGNYTYGDTTGNYNITVNGQQIEKTVTFTYGSSNFDTKVKRLNGAGHEHVNTEANVTTYKYKVSAITDDALTAASGVEVVPDTSNLYYAFAEITMPRNNIFSSYDVSMRDYRINGENITIGLDTYVQNKEEFEITIFGDLESAPQFTLYKNYGMTEVKGSCEVIEQSQKTFAEFAIYNKNITNISDDNWVNLYAEMLENSYSEDSPFIIYNTYLSYYMVNCWYVYSATIPAGGRVVNEVTAPLYPRMIESEKTCVCYYSFSPAERWADFKKLNITVNTPYYLTSGYPYLESTATDTYSVTVNDVTDLSIYLNVSTSKNNALTSEDYLVTALGVFVLSVLILLPVKIVTAVVVLIVAVSKNKKPNKK
jgi:hypothetical protein